MNRPVPGYAWLLPHGPKTAFAGVSNTLTDEDHPWHHGSKTQKHLLIAGLWTFDAELVVEVDQFAGYRLDQLLTMGSYSRDIDELVANGARIIHDSSR